MIIKLFGCKRTGTNYLTILLRQSFRINVLVNKKGWKHGSLPEEFKDPRNGKVVVLVKHPLAWLVSMHRYTKCPASLEVYIRSVKPLLDWNTWHTYWISLEAQFRHIQFCRYEDLITDPRKECMRLTGTKPIGFKDIALRCIPGETIGHSPFDKTYYTERRYLAAYSKELLVFCRNHFHAFVLKRFDYAC